MIEKNTTNNYQSSFAIFPQRIWNLPNITLAFLRIYETIFQFWNHDKQCFLTNKSIMERTNINSISTVIEAFKFFEKHNELKRVTIEGRRYLIQPERKIEIKNENDDPGGIDESIGGYRQTDTPPIDRAIHNTKKYNSKKLSLSCSTAVEREKEFESFWKLYPRKQNKTKALATWKKQKLYEQAPQILDSLTQQLTDDYQYQDKKFIPLPDAYLHGKRWEDEIVKDLNAHKSKQERKKTDNAITTRENKALKEKQEEINCSKFVISEISKKIATNATGNILNKLKSNKV